MRTAITHPPTRQKRYKYFPLFSVIIVIFGVCGIFQNHYLQRIYGNGADGGAAVQFICACVYVHMCVMVCEYVSVPGWMADWMAV